MKRKNIWISDENLQKTMMIKYHHLLRIVKYYFMDLLENATPYKPDETF